MRRVVLALLVGSLLSVVGLARAQSRTAVPVAMLELSEGSVAAGIGFSWGSGTLTYQGKKYPVRVQGLSVGEVGITRATAKGTVLDLEKLEDFSGNYGAAGAGAAVAEGAGASVMRNPKGVQIELISDTKGASLKLAVSGVQIALQQ
jgi:hypothetical protein